MADMSRNFYVKMSTSHFLNVESQLRLRNSNMHVTIDCCIIINTTRIYILWKSGFGVNTNWLNNYFWQYVHICLSHDHLVI